MGWPWKSRVREQEAAIRESEERREALESQWAFIRAQVAEARKHRRENHITGLIMSVARGEHR